MDANWRPTQGSDPAAVEPNAAAPAGGEWRAQLHPEARSRIINKIMETLKKHLPVSHPEGLNELQKIAVRFEERIYTAASNQSDYLRKISLKMLSMETKPQQATGNAQVIPSQNNSGPGCGDAGTTFSSGSKRRRVPPVVCLSADREKRVNIQRYSVMQVNRTCAEAAPNEPIFTCPVCLNKLEQPSTTTCGHIFCEKCIKASIKSQKKCPTCRKSLGTRSYHRVYLPATADQGC